MKFIPVVFVLILAACSGHRNFDESFSECRFEMMKVRMARPDMKFDKDPAWDRIFMRGLVIDCMKAKGIDSIPTEKLELIQ